MTDRQTDRLRDRQTERQTDRETKRDKHRQRKKEEQEEEEIKDDFGCRIMELLQISVACTHSISIRLLIGSDQFLSRP